LRHFWRASYGSWYPALSAVSVQLTSLSIGLTRTTWRRIFQALAGTNDSADREAWSWVEALAMIRKQSLHEMIGACDQLPDVVARLGLDGGRALSASEIGPVITKLPLLEDLERVSAGMCVTLATTGGVSIRLVTCDPLGSNWVSCGVALFPGEEFDRLRQQPFAVFERGCEVFCTTIEEFERALDQQGELLSFKVFGATLARGPGVAEKG